MIRFTIRDVLWLTVVVGVSIGWWSSFRVAVPTGTAKSFVQLHRDGRGAEEVALVDGLVGAGAVQLGRPVGGDHEQADAGVATAPS